MKLPYLLFFCFFLSAGISGQKKETLTTKDKQVVEHFKNDYKKKNYKRFEGKIIVTDNRIQFDDKIFLYDKTDKTTTAILKEGLVYPQLLADYQMNKFLKESEDKTQKRFLRLQKNPRDAFDVNNVLLKISEVDFLGSDFKVKRFRMISKDRKISASLTYFIELTNKEATEKTSFDDFIKGAKLTYVYHREID